MKEAAKTPEKLTTLLTAFDSITDLDERANMLVSYADRFSPVPTAIATRPFPPNHRVPMCESDAYVWGALNTRGGLDLYFAVENPSGISAKALAAILSKTLSGARPEEIVNVHSNIVERLFRRNLSMGKGMGLMGIVEMVRAIAARQMKAPVRSSQ
jgi:cysteine desulfuration protein SufE